MIRRRTMIATIVLGLVSTFAATAAGPLQSPERFLGFKIGADNKLARWDRIVDYMKLAAANSDRVRFRELGKTSDNNRSSRSKSRAGHVENLDRYKQLERMLFPGRRAERRRARRDLPAGQDDRKH
jgi:hypothetical protein